MPIEFTCTGCQQLLRIPDGAEGQQSKCPQCGTISDIPVAAIPTESEFSPQTPAPSEYAQPPMDSDNPFAAPDLAADGGETYKLIPAQLQPTTVSVSELNERTINTFTQNIGTILLGGFLLFLVAVVGQMVMMPLTFLQFIDPDNMFIVGAVTIVQQLWGIVVAGVGFCIGSRFVMFFLRGDRNPVQQMFRVGPYLGRSLILQLLLMFATLFVLAVCGAPALIAFAITQNLAISIILGIFGGAVYVFLAVNITVRGVVAQFLITEQDLNLMDAIATSKVFVQGNLLSIFGSSIIMGLLSLVAMLFTCFFAAFVISGFYWLFLGVVYTSVTGQWQPVPQR